MARPVARRVKMASRPFQNERHPVVVRGDGAILVGGDDAVLACDGAVGTAERFPQAPERRRFTILSRNGEHLLRSPGPAPLVADGDWDDRAPIYEGGNKLWMRRNGFGPRVQWATAAKRCPVRKLAGVSKLGLAGR
jgi:hypothetical protein